MMSELKLGITLAYLEEWEMRPPEWSAADLAGIDFIEIPGAALPADDAWTQALDAWRCEVGVHELMPARFIRQASAAEEPVRGNFRENFRERLRLAGRAGVRRISADFDLAQAGDDPAELERLAAMLPGFYQPLEEYQLTLLATARFPSALPEAWRKYPAVWNRLRFHRLGFALDVHIHEAAARELETELDVLIAGRRWELGLLRFHYEPELGNKLPARALAAAAGIYRKFGLPVTVTAAPLCLHPEALTRELAPIKALFDQVREMPTGADAATAAQL